MNIRKAVKTLSHKIFPRSLVILPRRIHALYVCTVIYHGASCLRFSTKARRENAYASVIGFTQANAFGYLLRQVHHWSAVTFVALIILHMGRVFFTAAFRAPRRWNWVIGFTLLVLAVLAGFTGYSLPFDELSGIGLRIANSVAMSVPVVGSGVATWLNGGSFPGPALLGHLALLHIFVLPGAIIALLLAHLGLLIWQQHTQYNPDTENVVGRRFWPDYALRMSAAFGLTVAVIFAFAAVLEINPIDEYGPYHDWLAPNPAVPDWYAAVLDGALRIGPAHDTLIFGHLIPAVFWPGVVMPGVVVTLMLCWPWIDAKISGETGVHDVLVKPLSVPWRVGVGAGLIAAGVILTLAASDDQQALALHAPIASLVLLYRIGLPLGAIATAFLAASLARQLSAREHLHGEENERVIRIKRNALGGFDDEEVGSL